MVERDVKSDADAANSAHPISYTDQIIDTVGNRSREFIVVDTDLRTLETNGGPVLNVDINTDSIVHINPENISPVNPDSIVPVGSPTADKSNIDTPFEEVVELGTRIDRQEYSVTGVNGDKDYIRIDGQPVRQNDKITAAVFVVSRVTEYRNASKKLTEIEGIVNALGDAVYIVNPNGKYEYINDSFTTLTGYTEEEVIGESPVIIKTESSIERTNTHRNKILSDAGPSQTHFEITIEKKSGENISCEDYMGVIRNEAGEFIGLAGVLRDISTVKQQQSEIERQKDTLENISHSEIHKSELEEQKAKLDKFVSVLTHDIRNPIAIAKGYLDKIKTDENVQDVEEIEDAHARIEAIIDDTLALFEETEEVADREKVLMSTIALEAWENVDTGDSELNVVDNFTISCNRQRIMRLFENVYRNSVEHNSSPVNVKIGKYEVMDTSLSDTSNNAFYISDDGVGIPENKRDSVFDFGETSSDGGTGLGLPIVKRVANAHNWNVHVRESATGGAKFIFV